EARRPRPPSFSRIAHEEGRRPGARGGRQDRHQHPGVARFAQRLRRDAERAGEDFARGRQIAPAGLSMKARSIELPLFFVRRSTTSPSLLFLASLPIAVIAVFVAVMIWVSFQRGMLGTPGAVYTLENYLAIFADPFLYRVLWNTAVFTSTTTVVALA